MSQVALENTKVAAEDSTTMKNLLTAYQGESNAHTKYVAFAAKAESDGFLGAASLFRAAARAESIHAVNHARVIKGMGGEATCEAYTVAVNTTLENLKTALTGERYEIDTMYPGFIREASSQKNAAALRTFYRALESENAHARLFSEAIKLAEAGLADSWIRAERSFYVCPVCGYTTETPQEYKRCPVCKCSWQRFEVIR